MKVKKTDNIFSPTDKTGVQLIRYTFVGGIAFLIDFGLLYILTEYGHFHYLLSAGISFMAGLTVNYLLSKKWVFHKSKIKHRSVEFILFGIIGLIGLGFNTLFLWIFTDIFAIYYMASKILTAILVYLWNFFARKYLLFTPREKET